LQQPSVAEQQHPHRPLTRFQPTTTPDTLQTKSSPAVPFGQPHKHPQPFDQMQLLRSQGAARSTSAPTRPPASTTILPSSSLPSERQGRVELESFPQAQTLNVASRPTQQQQQQWLPAEAAETPSRSSGSQNPVPPPAVPGRLPLTTTPSVARTNSTLSTLLPGIVPPMRIPNHPRPVAPAPARYIG
jgi:hypothetical protein